MTVVIGLLHGTMFLSNLTLVLFVSFIKPWQLERTLIKSLLIIIIIIQLLHWIEPRPSIEGLD